MLTDIFAVRRNPRACLRHFGVGKLKRGNLENQDIEFICPARCLHCSAQGVALLPGYSAVRYAIRKEPKCNGDATLQIGRRIYESLENAVQKRSSISIYRARLRREQL